MLIFINFISLRQAVTPAPMLGRMTSTMRWLILIPAGPGALIGGWLGDHLGLRAALGFSGICGALLTALAWTSPTLRAVRVLPVLGADGTPGAGDTAPLERAHGESPDDAEWLKP